MAPTNKRTHFDGGIDLRPRISRNGPMDEIKVQIIELQTRQRSTACFLDIFSFMEVIPQLAGNPNIFTLHPGRRPRLPGEIASCKGTVSIKVWFLRSTPLVNILMSTFRKRFKQASTYFLKCATNLVLILVDPRAVNVPVAALDRFQDSRANNPRFTLPCSKLPNHLHSK